jgi:hypothetical protein
LDRITVKQKKDLRNYPKTLGVTGAPFYVWRERFIKISVIFRINSAVVVEHSGQLAEEIAKAQPKGGRPKAIESRQESHLEEEEPKEEKLNQKIGSIKRDISAMHARSTDARLAATHGTNRNLCRAGTKTKGSAPGSV